MLAMVPALLVPVRLPTAESIRPHPHGDDEQRGAENDQEFCGFGSTFDD
jgi:hypothetical protein